MYDVSTFKHMHLRYVPIIVVDWLDYNMQSYDNIYP